MVLSSILCEIFPGAVIKKQEEPCCLQTDSRDAIKCRADSVDFQHHQAMITSPAGNCIPQEPQTPHCLSAVYPYNGKGQLSREEGGSM